MEGVYAALAIVGAVTGYGFSKAKKQSIKKYTVSADDIRVTSAAGAVVDGLFQSSPHKPQAYDCLLNKLPGWFRTKAVKTLEAYNQAKTAGAPPSVLYTNIRLGLLQDRELGNITASQELYFPKREQFYQWFKECIAAGPAGVQPVTPASARMPRSESQFTDRSGSQFSDRTARSQIREEGWGGEETPVNLMTLQMKRDLLQRMRITDRATFGRWAETHRRTNPQRVAEIEAIVNEVFPMTGWTPGSVTGLWRPAPIQIPATPAPTGETPLPTETPAPTPTPAPVPQVTVPQPAPTQGVAPRITLPPQLPPAPVPQPAPEPTPAPAPTQGVAPRVSFPPQLPPAPAPAETVPLPSTPSLQTAETVPLPSAPSAETVAQVQRQQATPSRLSRLGQAFRAPFTRRNARVLPDQQVEEYEEAPLDPIYQEIERRLAPVPWWRRMTQRNRRVGPTAPPAPAPAQPQPEPEPAADFTQINPMIAPAPTPVPFTTVAPPGQQSWWRRMTQRNRRVLPEPGAVPQTPEAAREFLRNQTPPITDMNSFAEWARQNEGRNPGPVYEAFLRGYPDIPIVFPGPQLAEEEPGAVDLEDIVVDVNAGEPTAPAPAPAPAPREQQSALSRWRTQRARRNLFGREPPPTVPEPTIAPPTRETPSEEARSTLFGRRPPTPVPAPAPAPAPPTPAVTQRQPAPSFFRRITPRAFQSASPNRKQAITKLTRRGIGDVSSFSAYLQGKSSADQMDALQTSVIAYPDDADLFLDAMTAIAGTAFEQSSDKLKKSIQKAADKARKKRPAVPAPAPAPTVPEPPAAPTPQPLTVPEPPAPTPAPAPVPQPLTVPAPPPSQPRTPEEMEAQLNAIVGPAPAQIGIVAPPPAPPRPTAATSSAAAAQPQHFGIFKGQFIAASDPVPILVEYLNVHPDQASNVINFLMSTRRQAFIQNPTVRQALIRARDQPLRELEELAAQEPGPTLPGEGLIAAANRPLRITQPAAPTELDNILNAPTPAPAPSSTMQELEDILNAPTPTPATATATVPATVSAPPPAPAPTPAPIPPNIVNKFEARQWLQTNLGVSNEDDFRRWIRENTSIMTEPILNTAETAYPTGTTSGTTNFRTLYNALTGIQQPRSVGTIRRRNIEGSARKNTLRRRRRVNTKNVRRSSYRKNRANRRN